MNLIFPRPILSGVMRVEPILESSLAEKLSGKQEAQEAKVGSTEDRAEAKGAGSAPGGAYEGD